jgi:hypothetical protein
VIEYKLEIGMINDNENLNHTFYHNSGTHIESGSDFEEEEAGWDLPLIQLENDHQPSSRYNRTFAEFSNE